MSEFDSHDGRDRRPPCTQVYRTEGLRLYEQMNVALRQNTAYSYFQYKPQAKQ